MKIKLITAVTGISEEKNELQKDYLREYLNEATQIDFDRVEHGFPSIESETHGIINAAEIIKKGIAAEKDGYDGIFVNCFDDPGVFALRELVKIPVFGGYLPSVLTALSLGERIGIITTDRAGILSEERKASHIGIKDRIALIEPVNLGVLELGNKDLLINRLTDICLKFEKEYRIQAASLGCTGMFYIIDELRERLKASDCSLVIIEPLATGIKYLETIIQLGFTNSLNYNLDISGIKSI